MNTLFNESVKSEYHVQCLVPELTCNLFSVRAAAEKGNTVNFGDKKCWIRDKSGYLRGMGYLKDKVYKLKCNSIFWDNKLLLQASSLVTEKETSFDLWHQRLGHVGEQPLKEMVKGANIYKTSQLMFCEGCVEGKEAQAI